MSWGESAEEVWPNVPFQLVSITECFLSHSHTHTTLQSISHSKQGRKFTRLVGETEQKGVNYCNESLWYMEPLYSWHIGTKKVC